MEKMLLSVAASLLGIVIGLIVYIWTRTISEYDKMIRNNTDDIGFLKDRMTAIETKHNDEMCKRKKK